MTTTTGTTTPADRLRATAADVFGWPRLRPGQLEAMEAVLAGHDTLVVMPTGAGKSAVYQVPALLIPGPTVVVSPLIALQRDQVAGLRHSHAPDAVAVNSAQSEAGTAEAWQEIRCGQAEYLFLSPEQLAKDDVIERLAGARPSLFVVDEAQCVSVWGHDFRPDYLRLRQAAERLGRPPVLALTATAAPPVRGEITEQLGMRDVHQVVAGFDRPNLWLEVRRFLDDADKRRAAVERAAALAKPGLIYTATRRDAERYAAELASLGLAACAYHAGLSSGERSRVHDRFLSGRADVVAATSAFGMGIDEPHVRFVIHASVPGSLDAYYQEIGRAGRDGRPADAVLLYRPEDLALQRYFTGGAPHSDDLRLVAEKVHAHRGPVSTAALRKRTGLARGRLTQAVNLLEQARGVTVTAEGALAAGEFAPPEAVERAVALAEAHKRWERSRVEMMRGYAETRHCRRQFMLGYFGEETAGPCGNCDICAAADRAPGTGRGEVAAPPAARHSAWRPGRRVRHSEWGEGSVMSLENDRVTILFDAVGYRTLSLEVIDERGLLTDVGEAPS